jgi:hypothetical protein
MKASLIFRPSSVRAGMFCRFGLAEDSRPVAVIVWLKLLCILPVMGFISFGKPLS